MVCTLLQVWLLVAEPLAARLPGFLQLLDSPSQQQAATQQLVRSILEPLVPLLLQGASMVQLPAPAGALQLAPTCAALWVQLLQGLGGALCHWRRPMEHDALMRVAHSLLAAISPAQAKRCLQGGVGGWRCSRTFLFA